jgi:hypothetical protein
VSAAVLVPRPGALVAKFRERRAHWFAQAHAECDPLMRRLYVDFARACHTAVMQQLRRDRVRWGVWS